MILQIWEFIWPILILGVIWFVGVGYILCYRIIQKIPDGYYGLVYDPFFPGEISKEKGYTGENREPGITFLWEFWRKIDCFVPITEIVVPVPVTKMKSSEGTDVYVGGEIVVATHGPTAYKYAKQKPEYITKKVVRGAESVLRDVVRSHPSDKYIGEGECFQQDINYQIENNKRNKGKADFSDIGLIIKEFIVTEPKLGPEGRASREGLSIKEKEETGLDIKLEKHMRRAERLVRDCQVMGLDFKAAMSMIMKDEGVVERMTESLPRRSGQKTRTGRQPRRGGGRHRD